MYVRIRARLMEGCEDVRMGESKVARRLEHRWRASLSHGAPICGDAHETSTEAVGAVVGQVGGMCQPRYSHVEPIDQQRLESDGRGQDGRHVAHHRELIVTVLIEISNLLGRQAAKVAAASTQLLSPEGEPLAHGGRRKAQRVQPVGKPRAQHCRCRRLEQQMARRMPRLGGLLRRGQQLTQSLDGGLAPHDQSVHRLLGLVEGGSVPTLRRRQLGAQQRARRRHAVPQKVELLLTRHGALARDRKAVRRVEHRRKTASAAGVGIERRGGCRLGTVARGRHDSTVGDVRSEVSARGGGSTRGLRGERGRRRVSMHPVRRHPATLERADRLLEHGHDEPRARRRRRRGEHGRGSLVTLESEPTTERCGRVRNV